MNGSLRRSLNNDPELKYEKLVSDKAPSLLHRNRQPIRCLVLHLLLASQFLYLRFHSPLPSLASYGFQSCQSHYSYQPTVLTSSSTRGSKGQISPSNADEFQNPKSFLSPISDVPHYFQDDHLAYLVDISTNMDTGLVHCDDPVLMPQRCEQEEIQIILLYEKQWQVRIQLNTLQPCWKK